VLHGQDKITGRIAADAARLTRHFAEQWGVAHNLTELSGHDQLKRYIAKAVIAEGSVPLSKMKNRKLPRLHYRDFDNVLSEMISENLIEKAPDGRSWALVSADDLLLQSCAND